MRWVCRTWRGCPSATCRRGSGGGWRWRASWSAAGPDRGRAAAAARGGAAGAERRGRARAAARPGRGAAGSDRGRAGAATGRRAAGADRRGRLSQRHRGAAEDEGARESRNANVLEHGVPPEFFGCCEVKNWEVCDSVPKNLLRETTFRRRRWRVFLCLMSKKQYWPGGILSLGRSWAPMSERNGCVRVGGRSSLL